MVKLSLGQVKGKKLSEIGLFPNNRHLTKNTFVLSADAFVLTAVAFALNKKKRKQLEIITLEVFIFTSR